MSDDQLAAEALATAGFTVQPAVWDEPGVPWQRFDALVIRSVWDYHLAPDRFRAWLDHLDQLGCPVWNPTSLLRWNLDKHYLQELAAAGIDTVPTVFLRRGETADLSALFARLGSDTLVLKPSVGASAFGAWRAERHQASAQQARLATMCAAHAVLVQPLVEAVLQRGEWSLVFFGGAFSHAVCKRPRAGDFRVQDELGGSAIAQAPPTALCTQAERILATLPTTPLYARVDLVETAAAGLLMELELVEPSLFFAFASESPRRFCRALTTWLGKPDGGRAG